MPGSQEIAELLRKLKGRLIAGDIDEATYHRQREILLSDLAPDDLAELGLTPSGATPLPGTPRPAMTSVSPTPGAHSFGPTGRPRPLGPSGGRGDAVGTRLEHLADLDLSPGTILVDKFKIVRELGRGGFGAVFEANHVKLGQTYALKVLDPAMVGREDLLARFKREVVVMQRLVHPHIARVFDYDDRPEERLALFAMEYLPGGSVADLYGRIKQAGRPFPVVLAMAILEQTLDALAEAHAHGIIHRDVSPANLLLGAEPSDLERTLTEPPQIKLIDFGIAGLAERKGVTRAMGTAAWAAPEVEAGLGEITSAADVFGAGAVAYFLLTGVPPKGHFKAPKEARSDIGDDLSEFILRLLETDPGDRPEASKARERAKELLADHKDGRKKRREAEPQAHQARGRAQTAERGGEAANKRARGEAQRAARTEVARPAGAGKPPVSPSPLEIWVSSKEGLEYLFIPPGEFEMGASPGDHESTYKERPRHRVRISRGFWLGRTPVTVGAYRRFCEATGREMPEAPDFNGNWQNENHPIVNVSWEEAAEYCAWAGGRLPTEAKWEYAARAGTTGRYWWGEEFDGRRAWCNVNSGFSTRPVGSKPSNPWKVQDMLGNVWEWCGDWFDPSYYASSPEVDPEGPPLGSERTSRGGSAFDSPLNLRISVRDGVLPARRSDNSGFRCARDVFPDAQNRQSLGQGREREDADGRVDKDPVASGRVAHEWLHKFDVVLEDPGEKKLDVMKGIRDLASLGLMEAKDLVQSAPATIKQGLSREEAREIQRKLEELGARATIRQATGGLAPRDQTPQQVWADPGNAPGWTVVLESVGERRINVIKFVREVTPLGLKEANDLVQSGPATIKQGLSREEAREIQRKLEELGARASIRQAT
ncbi:MAG: ribosomal protein L7/L12 [Acidobacteriia bacterium]|nr:ribosomal protein L7/L12 [Terriglobia bacterium]